MGSQQHQLKKIIVQCLIGFFACFILSAFFVTKKTSSALIQEAVPNTAEIKISVPMNKFFQQDDSKDEKNPELVQEISENVIGFDDITYQVPENTASKTTTKITPELLKQMENVDFLKQNYYLVDSRTALLDGDIKPQQFLEKDFTIDNSGQEPKVLIFHTHSTEGFVDSDMSKDMSEGIWGVGEELKNILEKKYGIAVLHDTGRYDMVDGKGQILGAYERMEAPIQKILDENPSIQVVIDMHRDGLPENVHLVTEINGKKCAKIMFFNGMCRLNKDGVPQPTAGLSNEHLEDNLAFSLQMQTTAQSLFPDFTRRIYIHAYRYSLHMKPRSLLIEVGSQMNTKQEAINAMTPLAEVLASVIQ